MVHAGHDDSARLRFTDEVRSYYDANTSRFERFGHGAAFVHRGVWGPNMAEPHEAFCYVENLLLEYLPEVGVSTVLDLGCGLGASLIHLARHRPIAGKGITISPVQARRAEVLIGDAGLDKQVQCIVGNFLALPDDVRDVDLAFSIEAFVHSPDATTYFGEVARVLRPGGRLALCDDFMTPDAADRPTPRTSRYIEEFRRGWRIGTLITPEQAQTTAESVGLRLVSDRDLTPYLRLASPRNRLLRLFADVANLFPVARRSPYWSSKIGGAALQRGLRAGALAYRLIIFERLP
jgi:cyclopropane fatty-acyl-phospholipid synthase-like methyltransferase